jgi:hypothetical protein
MWRAEPIPLVEIRIVGRRPAAVLRDRLWNVGKTAKTVFAGATTAVRQWFPENNAKPVVADAADVETAP